MSGALRLSNDDPRDRTLVEAIQAGQVETVNELVQTHSDLALARLVDEKGGSGTPLHAATDWPGFFANRPDIVAALIDAGADPNATIEGSWHAEMPLHWAASSDDVDVARALIDGGANIEAAGASIAGGSPLDDAVGYGCWQVARLPSNEARASTGSGSGRARPPLTCRRTHRRRSADTTATHRRVLAGMPRRPAPNG